MDRKDLPAAIPPLLALGIATVLAALMAFSAYSIVAIRDVYRQLDQVLRDRVPVVLLANDLTESDMALGIALRNATILRDGARVAAELETAQQLTTVIGRKVAELRLRASADGNGATVDRLAASRAELAAVQHQIVTAVLRGDAARATAILTSTLTEVRARHLSDVRALIDGQVRHMDGAAGDARHSTDYANAAVVAATVLALVASLLFVVALVRMRRTERAAAARRIASLEEQKAILVREVHHRIKNHLQGLLGLVQEYTATHPEVGTLSLTLQGQIQSLAAVHGLCARGNDQASLRALLETQVDLVRRSFDDASIDFRAAASCPDVLLRETDAVPVALIVSELLINALKYGDDVTLAVACDGKSICVTIRNRTLARAQFDFAGGTGLGTGLALVRSLMPVAGAAIEQECGDAVVAMALRLSPPVIASAAHG